MGKAQSKHIASLEGDKKKLEDQLAELRNPESDAAKKRKEREDKIAKESKEREDKLLVEKTAAETKAKLYEANLKQSTDYIATLTEQMDTMSKRHTEKVDNLNNERNVERKEMQGKLDDANSLIYEGKIQTVLSRSEVTAIAMGILTKAIAMGGVEKAANILAAKRDNGIKVMTRMKKLRRDFNLARDAPERETDKTFLKSMAEELTLLDSLIKDAIPILSTAAFDGDAVKQAMELLHFALGKIDDFFDEIAKLRVVLATTSDTTCLDGIKGYLKELELAIYSIPSMATQTQTQYIHGEMEKLMISQEQFAKNYLAPNTATPAVEKPNNTETIPAVEKP